MIEVQTEVLRVLELFSRSVAVVAVIGVTGVARVRCHPVLKSQVPMVVPVVVLVVVFLIPSEATLQFSRCPLVQLHTGSKVVTQSVEPIITVPVVVVLVLPV